METLTVADLVKLLEGAGTPINGLVVYLLFRLIKEIGELKTELKTFTDVMSRYVPSPRSDDR